MSAFVRDLVIHFDGETARVSPEQLARDCSLSVSDVLEVTRQLEVHGYLHRRADGEYDATVPFRSVPA